MKQVLHNRKPYSYITLDENYTVTSAVGGFRNIQKGMNVTLLLPFEDVQKLKRLPKRAVCRVSIAIDGLNCSFARRTENGAIIWGYFRNRLLSSIFASKYDTSVSPLEHAINDLNENCSSAYPSPRVNYDLTSLPLFSFAPSYMRAHGKHASYIAPDMPVPVYINVRHLNLISAAVLKAVCSIGDRICISVRVTEGGAIVGVETFADASLALPFAKPYSEGESSVVTDLRCAFMISNYYDFDLRMFTEEGKVKFLFTLPLSDDYQNLSFFTPYGETALKSEFKTVMEE